MNHQYVNVPKSDSGLITADFTLYDQNERQFENERKKIIDAILVNAPNINKDLQRFKAEVVTTFNKVFEQKKKIVLAENSFFEKLNININKKTDKIFKVPIAKKRKIPEPIVDKKTTKKPQKNILKHLQWTMLSIQT